MEARREKGVPKREGKYREVISRSVWPCCLVGYHLPPASGGCQHRVTGDLNLEGNFVIFSVLRQSLSV